MSMSEMLEELDWNIAQGWIDEKTSGPLSLFNYTDKCQMNGAWNKATRQARGLIIDRKAQVIVARPFKKFFNLNENQWSTISQLPVWSETELVEVTDKMDGSLGIIYWYEGEWRVATRGSFDSTQAVWANAFIHANWKLDKLDKSYTWLGEIIYPENRVVVDYKGMEDVVLLAAVHTASGTELDRGSLVAAGEDIGARVVRIDTVSGFDHLLKLKASLSFNTEGWVVHFPRTNQRVKIKTDDYLRVHRIVSNLSPLAMWESMHEGKVDPTYLNAIPDEFKDTVLWMQDTLEAKYKALSDRIDHTWYTMIETAGYIRQWKPVSAADTKTIALKIQKYDEPVIRAGLFAIMRGRSRESIIMENIRPTANVLDNPTETSTDNKSMT